MNAYTLWNRDGTIGVVLTNMDAETFSAELHEFQCDNSMTPEGREAITPKDFEDAMLKKGITCTYVASNEHHWWIQD